MHKYGSRAELIVNLLGMTDELLRLTDQQDNYRNDIQGMCNEKDLNPLTTIIQYTRADDLSWFYNEIIRRKEVTMESLNNLKEFVVRSLESSISLGDSLEEAMNTFTGNLELYQLQEVMAKLTKVEYDGDYETSMYKKLTTVIIDSIKENLLPVQIFHLAYQNALNFLKSLSKQDLGQLMLEHYTQNYNRNQGIYIDLLKTGLDQTFVTLVFTNTMTKLHKEFVTVQGDQRIAYLHLMEQTNFYQEQFLKNHYKIKE